MGKQCVLYMGDTALAGPASYLAGLMTAWGMPFEYVPSDRRLGLAQAQAPRKLFIFSDYPAGMLDSTLAEIIVGQVHGGAGLLMIGGWESYCGKGGNWAGTMIAEALPVEIGREDDRVNCDQPEDLIPSIQKALKDTQAQKRKRHTAVKKVYKYTDGRAAERAAQAIMEVL